MKTRRLTLYEVEFTGNTPDRFIGTTSFAKALALGQEIKPKNTRISGIRNANWRGSIYIEDDRT